MPGGSLGSCSLPASVHAQPLHWSDEKLAWHTGTPSARHCTELPHQLRFVHRTRTCLSNGSMFMLRPGNGWIDRSVPMKKLLIVIGARPNFMKVARFRQVAEARGGWQVVLVHTGQHLDDRMSTVFFEQLGMRPDHALGIQSETPNGRIAQMMLSLEPLLLKERPDLVMVVGDVDSTLAAALTCNKMKVRLAHLESGLRSRDRAMPEEFNRIVTDRVAQDLFVTEPSGVANLREEGRDEADIHLVGNTMIDSLVAFEPLIQASDVLDRWGLNDRAFALMTMHRPATVDDPAELEKMVQLMAVVARDRTVVFSMHPRTENNLRRFGLFDRLNAIQGVQLHGPMDYFAFQKLIAHSEVVITDSGGIQEETTYRRVPCLTLRANTERPITVAEGSNELLPFSIELLSEALDRIRAGRYKQGRIPHLWDGRATERVFDVLDRVP